jgi:hypothetical protein
MRPPVHIGAAELALLAHSPARVFTGMEKGVAVCAKLRAAQDWCTRR